MIELYAKLYKNVDVGGIDHTSDMVHVTAHGTGPRAAIAAGNDILHNNDHGLGDANLGPIDAIWGVVGGVALKAASPILGKIMGRAGAAMAGESAAAAGAESGAEIGALEDASAVDYEGRLAARDAAYEADNAAPVGASEGAAGDAQSLSPAKSNDENFAANRFYEGSDKHSSSAYTSGGKVVSPEPTNGQVALDNSVRVSADPRVPSRVGVDPQTGEITVFNRTGAKMGGDPNVWGGKQGGEYHGHVRQWNELTDPQRNALIKAGLTDKRGNILPSN